MPLLSDAWRCCCLSLGLLLSGASAYAQSAAAHTAAAPTALAPASIALSDFDESTWATLLHSGPRPAAYVFTTSYCSTCPDAFAKVHAVLRGQHAGVPLAVVMMDVAGAQALRHALHFQGLTRMYAFDGFEPAIRYSVDPAWPHVTPYVVLIDKHGRLQRFIGPPSPKALRAWLG
jgi:hypothetical protein